MEMESAEPTKEIPKEPTLLERIRNMWEFANLVQFIFIFGRAVKIDENLDVEVICSMRTPSGSLLYALVLMMIL